MEKAIQPKTIGLSVSIYQSEIQTLNQKQKLRKTSLSRRGDTNRQLVHAFPCKLNKGSVKNTQSHPDTLA